MTTIVQVKSRTILFSAEMVRAILDGRKTQTRRVVKLPLHCRSTGCELTPGELSRPEINSADTLCPYGAPGDHLWVRETFAVMQGVGAKYRADNPGAAKPSEYWDTPWTPSIFMQRAWSRITLEIVGIRVERLQEISETDSVAEGIDLIPRESHWESCQWYRNYENPKRGQHAGYAFSDARLSYQTLWDSINAKRGFGWAVNPWVWKITFKRIN